MRGRERNAPVAEPTQRRSAARSGRIRALSLCSAAGELRTMINLIVLLISAIMLALLLVWWRWPAFHVWIEAPKYSMLRQERRFDDPLPSERAPIRYSAWPTV